MTNTVLIIAIIGVVYTFYKVYQQRQIDPNLKHMVDNGAIILDVRTSSEFSNGHIKNAMNISLGEIRERYTELDPSATYITCCSHGLRSVKVKSLLESRGFKNVYNGGVWQDLEKKINGEK